MSDYLWDKSGAPDPDVQRLEQLLGGLRHDKPLADLGPAPVNRRRPVMGRPQWMAAAAAIVVLVGASVWLLQYQMTAGWDVASLAGAPRVGDGLLAGKGLLPVGEWLSTDASSRARIEVGQIGEVEVEPNTRLRLVRSRLSEQRMALDRGKIHARIWAPPRLFFVDTPSAVAVDLGCAYTLEVDEQGTGLLRVTAGWVGFEADGRESFIPATAACVTRKGTGPGTPYYVDASDAFVAALHRLDQGEAAALAVVLQIARQRDALTLWHLLFRRGGVDRGQVYDRMAALIPPPAGVTRAGVLDGNRRMTDLWWNELGLGDTSWWRLWKGPWPPRAK